LSRSCAVIQQSQNGEIHLPPESMVDKIKDTAENYDEVEIRTFMKKEADKPLLLLPEE
jgi:hypothetical protein